MSCMSQNRAQQRAAKHFYWMSPGESLLGLWSLPLLLSQVSPEPNLSPLLECRLPQDWAGPNHRTKHAVGASCTLILGYCSPWLPPHADGTGTYHPFSTIISSLRALMEDFMLITCKEQNHSNLKYKEKTFISIPASFSQHRCKIQEGYINHMLL